MKQLIYLFVALAILSPLALRAQNEDVSGGAVFEGEPYMAVDPHNADHIVVAWMGYVAFSHTTIKVKTSFDGGTTWSAPVLLPHYSATYESADISMAFGPAGDLYASYIDSRKTPDSGAVYVVRSTDGGLTWGTPAPAITVFSDGSKEPIDRPWLTVSNNTTGADTLYITTKPPSWISLPNRPYFVRSWDHGVTWSAFRYIDSTGYLVGNVIKAPMAAPAVDSAGNFHCIYPTYLPSESINPRYILASHTGANSFNYHTAYTVIGAGGTDTLAKAGARMICDPTNNQHYALFVIGNLLGDLDVYYLQTFDAGATWTSPVRVNDDATANGKMQDLVWSNFDEHGNIIAAWRDRRNAPGTGYSQPSEIWGAVRWHDSAGFSPNFRISDTIVAYDSVYLSGNGNDFMNVAMANDTMSAVWGDVRTGALNIWFSRRAMGTMVPTATQHLVHELTPEVNIYPNPVNDALTIEGDDVREVTIYSVTGRAVLHKNVRRHETTMDVSSLVPGTYVVTVSSGNGVVSQEITKH